MTGTELLFGRPRLPDPSHRERPPERHARDKSKRAAAAKPHLTRGQLDPMGVDVRLAW
jgi:hypothetical protein